MKILRIKFKNIHSLQTQVDIDFTKPPFSTNGIFAIVGETGAGKTSILDAITLALYGRIARDSKAEEILSYGAIDAFSSVEFEIREQLYLAKWSAHIKKKGAGAFDWQLELGEYNAEVQDFQHISTKKTEALAKINEITGLDYSRFKQSVLLAQGDFAAFLKAKDSERSDLLERMTGTEIYSVLSKAAFERTKTEVAKLAEIQTKMGVMNLMTAEEVSLCHGLIQETHLERDRLKIELDTQKSKELLMLKLDEAKKNLHDQKTLKIELEAQKNVFQQQLQRIDLHQKMSVLKPIWDQKMALLTENQSRKTLIDAQDIDKNKHLEAQSNIETKRNQALTQSQHLQHLFIENEPFWSELLAVQRDLEHVRPQHHEKLKNYDLAKAKINDIEQGLNRQKLDNQKFVNSKAVELEWLSANQLAKDIPLHMQEIKRKTEELLSLIENGSSLKKAFEAAISELENEKKEGKKLELDVEKMTQKELSLNESFSTIAAQKEKIEHRRALIQDLQQQKETVSVQLQAVSDYLEYHKKEQIILAQISKMDAVFEKLILDEKRKDVEMLNIMDQLDEYRSEEKYHQQFIDIQAFIKKERIEIESGKPCSVCGVLHDPKKHTLPDVDFEAQANYKLLKIQEKVAELYATQRDHFKELSILQGEINGYKFNLDEHADEEKINLVNQRNELEANLREKQQVLPSHLRNAPEYDILTFNTELEIQKNKLEKQILDLEACDKQLIEIEKNRQTESQKYELKQLTISRLVEILAEKEKALLTQRSRFTELDAELKTFFGNYNIQFDYSKVSSQIDALQQQQIRYENTEQTIANLSSDIEKGTVNEANLQAQIKVQLVDNQQLEQNWKAVAEQLAQLETKEKTLVSKLGEHLKKDVLVQKMETVQALTKALNLEMEAIQKAIQEIEQNIRLVMQLMDDAHQKIDVLNEDIQARFKVLNLDKNTDILNFILTENEIQHIENQRIELEKSLNNNELKCKELSEEIQNMNDQIDADANLSALRDAILSIENQLNEANKQLGILDEKLSNNAKNQAAVADFQAQYQVQQHELNRWDALSNLIGSADGAKFRVFAQGLTLQHLTHLANKHLDKLNSRYLIRKREGDTLQLDIEDTEQANNRRPMNTLSGGESFLASLALALGLSDLAGRKNDIGSLFIDEGFGTLDDDVLETALITLENLRGQGKMIGIISHVSGLKSRIDTQIQVRKLGNGRSEIVVVG